LQIALLLESLFPTHLQRSHHQSILRLNGVILSLGPAELVLRAFEFLTPLIVQTRPLLLDVLLGVETEFQNSRFQSTQQFLSDQRVQRRGRDATAALLQIRTPIGVAVITRPLVGLVER